jgi:radical SAM superfamily enzyme YgiQ (UPF0313 family)
MAAVLRDDHDVSVRDYAVENISDSDFLDSVAGEKPDILIAATSTQTIDSDLEYFKQIKSRNDVTIAVFGVHATVFAENILKKNPVDFVIRNEPELTARELVSALTEGRNNLETIQGITFRVNNTSVKTTKPRPFIENLDALPFPAWELVDISPYKLPGSGRNYIIINTLRGCPFRCSFCTTQVYYGQKARVRSPQSLLSEIQTSVDRFGIKDIFFWGDTFTLNKKQIFGLCRGIFEQKLDIRWVANSRVDTVDEETLNLMKEAGCWLLSCGIESGDDSILERCNKNITVETIEKSVVQIKNSGLKIAGHFILGLPGETEESARRTIRLAQRLKLDFYAFYSAAPYPGSSLYEEASSKGWVGENDWAEFNQSEFAMDLPTISRKKLIKLKRRAYSSVYLRPRILKTVFFLLTVKSFISLLVSAATYLSRIRKKK